jgi:hypothetical protein
MSKTFLVYGLLVLAGVGYGEYRGFSFSRVGEVKNVPRSVRDNPGSYRSVYGGYHHYTGGK